MQLPTSLGWRWIWSRSGRAEGAQLCDGPNCLPRVLSPRHQPGPRRLQSDKIAANPYFGDLVRGKSLVTKAKKKISELETQLQQQEGERNELLSYHQQVEREQQCGAGLICAKMS